MTSREAIAFVRRHGIVLESGRGPVPSLAEAVAGGLIRGSWWGHPQGHEIWRVTRAVRGAREILVCRLMGGKVTYVHRRLWPALVRLADEVGPGRLAAIKEVHLPAGHHEVLVTPFPKWVPAAVMKADGRLGAAVARAEIGFDALRRLR
jgi:hypothetical protein